MSLHCENCGKDEVDEEDEVCHSCGFVSDKIEVKYNHFSSENHTSLKLYRKKKNSELLHYGRDMLTLLCHQLSVNGEVKDKAAELLSEMYDKKYFRRKADMCAGAGCCLAHHMKLKRMYVSIVDVCKKLGCTKKAVFKCTRMVKEYWNSKKKDCVDEDEGKPIEMAFKEKIPFVVKNFLESLPIGNKDVLETKTVALCNLANSLWLTSGRSLEGVVCASVFLCHMSMTRDRTYNNFTQFCRTYSLNYPKGLPRVKEIKDMLFKLGQNIPAMSKNYVTEKNVLCHLDYILEHSNSLRNDLLSDEITHEEVEKKEFVAFRKVLPGVKGEDLPSVCGVQATTAEVGDAEISDTEISSYIRSDKQVEAILSLQNKTI